MLSNNLLRRCIWWSIRVDTLLCLVLMLVLSSYACVLLLCLDFVLMLSALLSLSFSGYFPIF